MIAVVLLGLVALGGAIPCIDFYPSGDYNGTTLCPNYASWGQCNISYHAGYCAKSCNRCNASTSNTNLVCSGVASKLNNGVFALGVNFAGYRWANGWMTDFHNDDSIDTWADRLAGMKSTLLYMKSLGVRVVRWWMFARGDEYIFPNKWTSATPSLFTGLPDNWTAHANEIFTWMGENDMYAYVSVFSFDWGAGSHSDVINNTVVQKSWLENGIKPLAEALKSNKGIFGWDVCNEPEWLLSSKDGGSPCKGCPSNGYNLSDVRYLFKQTIATLRAAGVQQPISIGSAALKFIITGGDYELWNTLDLDFWDFHWYSWATNQGYPLVIRADTLKPVRPVVIGEFQPNPGSDSILAASTLCDGGPCTTYYAVAKRLAIMGYSGLLPWAWTDPNYNCTPYMGTHFAKLEKECSYPNVTWASSSKKTTVSSTASPEVSESADVAPVAESSAPTDVVQSDVGAGTRTVSLLMLIHAVALYLHL